MLTTTCSATVTVHAQALRHNDTERIPERVVHAVGAGAHGYFEVTNPEIKKYCRAKIFDTVGKRTPMFARISTVSPDRGGSDLVRDLRGFALKFYTEEGNWDLVGTRLRRRICVRCCGSQPCGVVCMVGIDRQQQPHLLHQGPDPVPFLHPCDETQPSHGHEARTPCGPIAVLGLHEVNRVGWVASRAVFISNATVTIALQHSQGEHPPDLLVVR